MRKTVIACLALSLAVSCSHRKVAQSDWSAYRTAALRVDTRVDETDIEVNWIKKLVKIELERGKLFDEVAEIAEGLPPKDLHIFLTIVRKKGWLWNKLFVDIEFIDAKTNAHLGRERIIAKSSSRVKDVRSRHKAAGQIAYKVARRTAARIAQNR